MKTIVSAIALVAVSATASMAGDFSLSQAGNANGKLWTFTHDNGSNWNFYGTSYVDGLKADLAAEQSRVANLANALTAAESSVVTANTIIAENSVRIAELEAMIAEVDVTAVAELEAEISSLELTVAIQHDTILRMSSEAQMYMGLFSDANEEVSRLTAELAVANADLADAAAEIAELSANQAPAVTVSGDYVPANHSARITNYSARVNSDGSVSDDESYATITINGQTFNSATLNENGSMTGTFFGAGEGAQDWAAGFEDGYNAGFDDGYEAGYADGFADGVASTQ